MMIRRRVNLPKAGILLLSMALMGCSAAPTPAPTSDLIPLIAVENAYGQVSAMVPGAGEFFMDIKNSGMAADRLISAKSDACEGVEIREMITKADGTTELYPRTDALDIPSRGQVEIKDGGYYRLLCTGLKAGQFKPGAKLRLALVFDTTGDLQVNIEIREAPAFPAGILVLTTPLTAP